MNKFLRITAIGSIFLIPFIPFIVSSSLFFPFITGKNFIFRILTEVSLASWIMLALRDAAYRPRKSAILWAFVAFVAIIGIADISGVNAWKSFWSNFERMEGYVTLLHLLGMFIVAGTMLSTERLWERFLQTSLGASVVASLFAVFQLAGVFTINQGGVRVDATFGNATYLAIYLVFNIFFALIFFARSRGWGARAGYAAIVILHSAILYHTATRGAILGLLGGLLLSALLIAIFDKKERVMRTTAWSVIGAIAVIAIGFTLAKDTDFVRSSPVMSRFINLSLNETGSQARAYVWPMAIEGWKERPILGWGQENFNYVFNKDYDPRMYHHEQWFDRTHNAFLDWLVQGGILGLLAYLSLFVSAVYLLWRKCPDASFTEKALLTGLGAAYLFHNLFVFDNITSYTLFVSILAYVHFRSARLSKPAALDKDEVDDGDTRMIGAFVLVLLVASLYFFNYRGYATSQSLLDAMRSSTVSPIRIPDAIASFEKALSYDTLGRPEVVERMIETVP
ncbi:MAG: O-antigen ligase family protein, partial [Candidatus Paceibacterota bacterium]